MPFTSGKRSRAVLDQVLREQVGVAMEYERSRTEHQGSTGDAVRKPGAGA